MKTNHTYQRNERRRPANRYTNTHRPNKFEIQLNVFFYRLFGGLSLFILFAVIYAGAWHHLLTAALTAVMAWVIYDQNKKNRR